MTIFNLVTETEDAAAATTTTLTLPLGSIGRGTIGPAGDKDWFAIDLVAGRTYSFAAVGTGTTDLRDPLLTLMSASGAMLAENDDSLPNLNSALTFTASETGRHFLQVSGFGTASGSYRLAATEGARPSIDAHMVAGVIDSHSAWSAIRGAGAAVTFGFRSSTTGGEPNFTALSSQQMAATRAILAQTAEMTGLTFTDVNPNGLTNDATILLGNYTANDGAGAYASMPGSTASSSVAGDIWINTAPVTTTIRPGSWDWFVTLHELGHALGLDHPGDYNAGVGVSITYANNAEFVQDSHQFSVESYFGASATGASGLMPDTWMLADIIALQAIYGANMATRTGHTTYGYGSNAGQLYDFTVNTDPMICLWDAGGTDTIDVSRYTGTQLIDLREEAFSDVLGFRKNLSIAPGAVIENAKGGSGADTMIGNAAGNRLTGNAGADSLTGHGGNDVLDGGAGADTMAGGLGNDAYYVDAPTDLVIEALREGTDTILTTASFALSETSFIETLRAVSATFSGNLTLTGNMGANLLTGGAGSDMLAGGGGRDVLNPGNDAVQDIIIFRTVAETSLTNRDVVQGFDTGEDLLDLRGIDANASAAGDQAFVSAGLAASANAVWTVISGTSTILYGDVTGDTKADMMIVLSTVNDLAVTDLLL